MGFDRYFKKQLTHTTKSSELWRLFPNFKKRENDYLSKIQRNNVKNCRIDKLNKM